MKSQSLNAEEEEGPLSPLIAEGFSRQRKPCVCGRGCVMHGYRNCLYGVRWKPKFTSWPTAVWQLGALGRRQGRAVSPSHALNIHCAVSSAGHRPEPTKTVMSSLGRRSDGWTWEVDMVGDHQQPCAGRSRGICSVFYEGFCCLQVWRGKPLRGALAAVQEGTLRQWGTQQASTCCCISAGILGILLGLLRPEITVSGEPLPGTEPRSSGTSACVHALPPPFQAINFPSIAPLC